MNKLTPTQFRWAVVCIILQCVMSFEMAITNFVTEYKSFLLLYYVNVLWSFIWVCGLFFVNWKLEEKKSSLVGGR